MPNRTNDFTEIGWPGGPQPDDTIGQDLVVLAQTLVNVHRSAKRMQKIVQRIVTQRGRSALTGRLNAQQTQSMATIYNAYRTAMIAVDERHGDPQGASGVYMPTLNELPTDPPA